MSQQIDSELANFGVAQVIVRLSETSLAVKPGTRALSAASAATRIPVAASRAAINIAAEPLRAIEDYFLGSSSTQDLELGLSLSRKRSTVPKVRYFPNLGVMLGAVDSAGLKSLQKDKRVKNVSGVPQFSLIRPDQVKAAALANKITWGIEALDVPKVWAKGFTGKGVVVGHLDTGVDGTHPALKKAIGAFAQFDTLGFEVTPAPAAFDSGEHGTHTAGTIAGRTVSGKSIGVAPGAMLASALVIEGGNVIARILAGMDWGISQGMRVMSMSLGLRGFHDDFMDLMDILRARNVLPVIAVGNEGPSTSRSPGNYTNVLSVGASDVNKLVAGFSSSQKFVRPLEPLVPDLVAPGVGVISAKPGGGFQEMDGSSMATPHIAGLAALLVEAKPDRTAAEIEVAILKSCKLPATMPKSRANRGLPNALRALNLL